MANLTAYIFGRKHGRHKRASTLAMARGLLYRPKTIWTLVNKRLQIDSEFSPTLRKICIPLHCHASQTDISKRNSTNLIRWTVNRVEKSGSSLPKKWGTKNFYICSVFRQLRYLMAKLDIDNRTSALESTKGLLHCPLPTGGGFWGRGQCPLLRIFLTLNLKMSTSSAFWALFFAVQQETLLLGLQNLLLQPACNGQHRDSIRRQTQACWKVETFYKHPL